LGLSDGETDMNSDAGDTDMPFEIFTLRNLINFYLDLAGQEFPFDAIENKMLLIVVATIVGLLFVGIFFY
jgi:hypothetical protein